LSVTESLKIVKNVNSNTSIQPFQSDIRVHAVGLTRPPELFPKKWIPKNGIDERLDLDIDI